MSRSRNSPVVCAFRVVTTYISAAQRMESGTFSPWLRPKVAGVACRSPQPV